jgi:hypothetical protein
VERHSRTISCWYNKGTKHWEAIVIFGQQLEIFPIHYVLKENGRVVGPQPPQGGLAPATPSKDFNYERQVSKKQYAGGPDAA